MHGFLDGFEQGVLRGWAWNSNTGAQVSIKIEIDGEIFKILPCNLYRSDLEEAGVGAGYHAFECDLRGFLRLKRAGSLKLQIEVIETGARLTESNSAIYNSYSRIDGEIQKKVSSSPTATIISQRPSSPYRFNRKSKSHIEMIIRDLSDSGKELFIFAPLINWDIDLFQRPQQLALAMSRLGHAVIYVTPNWPNTEFVGYGAIGGIENLIITDDWSYVKENTSGNVIVASTSSVSIDEIRTLRRNGHVVIYDYIDHISPEISGAGASVMLERHQNLTFDAVSSIVASADLLHNEMLDRFPSEIVHLAKNAVDENHYIRNDAKTSKLAHVISKRKKIIGYFGAIAPWLDIELLNQAFKNDEFEFVIIGPDYDGNSSKRLEQRENVTITGSISYWELPQYAECFDVAIIPFRPGDVAKSTSPLKLYEYFALGIPVVVEKDMHECTPYFGVLSYRGAEEFKKCLSDALEMFTDSGSRSKIKETARNNSWSARVPAFVRASKSACAFADRLQMSHNVDARAIMTRAYSISQPHHLVAAFGGTNDKEAIVRLMNESSSAGDVLEMALLIPSNVEQGAFKLTLNIPQRDELSPSVIFQFNIDDHLVGWASLPLKSVNSDIILPAKMVSGRRVRFSLVVDGQLASGVSQKMPLIIKNIKYISSDQSSRIVETSGIMHPMQQINPQVE